MTDPFRLRVMKALTAALEEITVANGYQHDLAGSVFRGRLLLSPQDPLPCIALNEPPKPAEALAAPEGSSVAQHEHEVLVQGFVRDDRVHPTDPAYRLLADVQKRLALARQQDNGFDILGLGPRVSDLRLGQAVVRPPDEVVANTAFFWMLVTLVYAEDLSNPFA